MKKLLLLSALFIFACSTDSEGNSCIYEPTLTTQAATDITETSATLNGVISIVSENCDVPNNTEQGFVYSTEIQPTLEDIQINVNGTNITTTIEGLEPNTTYYVRAFLTNNLGDFYGDEVSFMTSNDGGDNSNNYKLVDTITVSYEYEDIISGNLVSYEDIISYSYDGNKLLNTSNGEVIVNFTYNEDNKISTVYNPGFYVAEFEYDNQGRVSVYNYTEFDGDETPETPQANFVYNQDGSVIQTWQGSQEVITRLFDDNGNMVTRIGGTTIEQYDADYYTYDNKNNPFKNITGNGFFLGVFTQQPFLLRAGVSNNVLTYENENNILFYTYDDDDFPTNINSPYILRDGVENYYNIQINITYTN